MSLVPFIGPILEIVDKFIPDPQKKAEIELELWRAQQDGRLKEIELDIAEKKLQTDTNLEEAKSSSLWVAGWRPAVGWVCVLGLTYTFVAQPLLSWASALWAIPVPPSLDLSTLITLLGGMLGLGALRTTEKIKRVAR